MEEINRINPYTQKNYENEDYQGEDWRILEIGIVEVILQTGKCVRVIGRFRRVIGGFFRVIASTKMKTNIGK